MGTDSMGIGTRDFARAPALSAREIAVLEVVAMGLTNAQAAQQLGVSPYAIKFHLSAIYRKLSLSNRTEAAVWLLHQRDTSGVAV